MRKTNLMRDEVRETNARVIFLFARAHLLMRWVSAHSLRLVSVDEMKSTIRRDALRNCAPHYPRAWLNRNQREDRISADPYPEGARNHRSAQEFSRVKRDFEAMRGGNTIAAQHSMVFNARPARLVSL